MNDLIPLGTGNSRFMKSGISPNTTYQQLLTMLINGTFPFDFNGINPAGVSQMGSAYSVANVLPKDVCTELDIPNTSEPKDAFSALNNIVQTKSSVGYGSYVGTLNTTFQLVFPQAPKLIFVYGGASSNGYYNYAGIFLGKQLQQDYNADGTVTILAGGNSSFMDSRFSSVVWDSSGTQLTLQYSGNAYEHLNGDETYTYFYFI